MVNDPIGDMIIQFKNAGMTGKEVVELPYSRLKYEVACMFAKEGFVKTVAKISRDNKREILVVTLRYIHGKHAILGVKRMSKPGVRLYVGSKDIPTVMGGMGIAILSTPKGIMTGNDAKKAGVGGELLCEVW